MKKFFAALTMFAVLLTSSIALAAFEETIEDDVDLSAVKKIAVAYPNYYKMEDTEPEIGEFMRSIYEAGKMESMREILSYEDIASGIRRETGIDIHLLDVPEAEKIYNAHVAKYADSYVVATVANNSGMAWLFFYVYNASDQKLMYAYSIQSRVIKKNGKDYLKAAEGFFKQFDAAAAENLPKDEKKKLKEKQKEFKASKRKIKRVIYKTGESKVDKVKKK